MNLYQELLARLRAGEFAPPVPGVRPVVPVVEIMCFCPNCDDQVIQWVPCCPVCGQVFHWPSVALVEGGQN